ncbi:unnamed protein product [Leuciscus chuanchicus]
MRNRVGKGASGVGSDEVSVMEGDSVTLNTGVNTTRQDDFRWYYNGIRIAQINGDINKTCTDVQCNEGNERFRDRLKLDHQTGSLTIMNITITDAGEYTLNIISNSRDSSRNSGKIFNVNVQGVSAAERDEVKRNKGESVTFDPPVARKPNDVMTWYFNEILIAEITGDLSKTCTDVQCKERFRDRLKLDHQTGSLIITNITNTDSGEYKLQIIIINSSFSITRVKRFNLSVIDVPGSGLSSGAVAGIVVGVLLVFAAAVTAAVIYYRHRKSHAPVPQDEDDADSNRSPDPDAVQDDDADSNRSPDPDAVQDDDADSNRSPDPDAVQEDNADSNPSPNPDVVQDDDADNPPPYPNAIPLEDMEHH